MGGVRRTVRELAAAQKPARGVSYYSRLVNRPAGRVLAAVAHRLGLSPNQVTLASGACTAAGIVTIAVATPAHPVAAVVYLALALGFALDSADGQLARLTGTQRASGEWLDHVLDCARLLALHMAVLIAFYRFFDLPHSGYLLAPMVFQFAAVLVFFGGILTEQLKRRAAADAPVAPTPAAPSRLRSLALLPADYGVFCVIFLCWGDGSLFLALYCAFLVAQVGFLVVLGGKWYRELASC